MTFKIVQCYTKPTTLYTVQVQLRDPADDQLLLGGDGGSGIIQVQKMNKNFQGCESRIIYSGSGLLQLFRVPDPDPIHVI